MKYMMDTCTFIWYLTKNKNLSDNVKEIIYNSDEVYISFATLWEIAIKQAIGKLGIITMSIFDLVEFCQDNGIIIMPLKFAYLEKTKQLQLIHRDPFDRIIIASSTAK